MKQYIDLLKQILSTGNDRGDRTGTGTRSIFGPTMRFNLKEGFPLVTTKKVHLRAIIHELLWFLRGSTDNTELEALDVKIWDLWAVKEDVTQQHLLYGHERVTLLAQKLNLSVTDAVAALNAADQAYNELHPENMRRGTGGYELLKEYDIPEYKDIVVVKRGELGPIYGKQWRSWPTADSDTIDQLGEVIEMLKKNPFSRRLIVSAWNPAVLPDESKSPEQNVIEGRQALASCHCLFHFYYTPMTLDERYKLYQERNDMTFPTPSEDHVEEALTAFLNDNNIPKGKLSCLLYQRKLNCALAA